MKKYITIVTMIFLVLVASSCKNEKSLQNYLVETSGKDGFFTGDLPVSSILTPKTDVSESVKNTIRSIKKINYAFLSKTAENDAQYEAETEKLKHILVDNKAYTNLMSMKAKGMHIKVYYTGKTDAIDEVILFGYNSKMGVGVARLLGDEMNPAAIMQMMQSVEMDGENGALENILKGFIK